MADPASTPTEPEAQASPDAQDGPLAQAEPGARAPEDPGPAATPSVPRPSRLLAHDLLVVGLALAILFGAHRVHRQLTRPRMKTVALEGLTLRVPSGWFPERAAFEKLPERLTYTSSDPAEPFARVEIQVGPRPVFDGPLGPTLEIGRARRHTFYQRLSSGTVKKAGRDWLCTRYAYAFKATDDDVPHVAAAVEYAVVNGERLYVVTLHGSSDRLAALESATLGNLAVR